MDIINLIMFTNFKNYLLQDISRRFNNNDFLHCFLRFKLRVEGVAFYLIKRRRNGIMQTKIH